MKSPIKELSAHPLIDVWHINGTRHGPDSTDLMSLSALLQEKDSFTTRKLQESQMFLGYVNDTNKDAQAECGRESPVTKKKVSFSSAVISIHYPLGEQIEEAAKSTSSVFWYSTSDFQRFRAESYDIAAKASGDVDYQHFFLNFVYRQATAFAAAANLGFSATCPSVTYAPFFGPYAKPLTTNYMSICIDSFSDLCLLSKYRGLERIIFRNLVQPSKLSYIDGCIQFHKVSVQMESLMESSRGKVDSSIRQHAIASQVVAQYLGQIDDIISKELVRGELQQGHQISTLSSQPVHLSFPLADSLPRPQRSGNYKKTSTQRRRCFMEL